MTIISNNNNNKDKDTDELVGFAFLRVEDALKQSIPQCYHEYLRFYRHVNANNECMIILCITTNLNNRLIKQMFGGMFMSLSYDYCICIKKIDQNKNTFRIKIKVDINDTL